MWPKNYFPPAYFAPVYWPPPGISPTAGESIPVNETAAARVGTTLTGGEVED